MINEQMINIAKKFCLKGKQITHLDKYGEGHINETYLVILDDSKKYILQRINNHVFKNVDGLMNNIVLVTNFLKEELKRDSNKEIKTMEIVPTIDGKTYFEDSSTNKFYRVYKFVEDSVTFQSCDTKELFKESAIGFATFAKQLNDFDATQLCEVIPNFHNTLSRFKHFEQTLKEDKLNRASSVKDEIAFVLERKNDVDLIAKALENKEIPLRVTHNDTKLNNILLNKDTLKSMCVIDLDTVMPGSILYDFGDSIRFGCNKAGENERDLSKVNFDLDYYNAYLDGYLSTLGNKLTKREIELLPYGAKLMTLECGIRFLDDYLDGDHYFAIKNNDDNLVRARTQFKLVKDMERELF